MFSADQALTRFAAAHHGVFATGHASMLGFTERQIVHRTSTGRWLHRHLEAYYVAGAPPSWKGDLLAACWAGGFRAVASHRSAAALWGLAGGRRSIQEITCPRWRRARHNELVVHETKAFDPTDATVIEGIPVTTPERTLLDLGAVCHESVVEMALDAAEKRELVTLDSVRATVARLGQSGRNGVGTIRRLVDARSPERNPLTAKWRRCSSRSSAGRDIPSPSRSTRFVAQVGSSPRLTPGTRSGASRSSTTATSTTPVERRSIATANAETRSLAPDGYQ
jgi:hypothetical protein